MNTLTIKLEPEHDAWLEQHARSLKRSKGAVIRELIQQPRQSGSGGSLAGSPDLSTRPLKGYGRR